MVKIERFDVIVIGGSYAGLSAAMSLARALRKVLILDSGTPCNRFTPQSHNFITRDGESPSHISALAKAEVLKYPTVQFRDARAMAVTRSNDHFNIQTDNNAIYSSSMVVFATGVLDIIPDIAGFAECWGISILHCPYCHGYEFQKQRTGIFANGEAGYDQSKFISNWTSDLILYTNGKSTLTQQQTQNLKKRNIKIEEKEIEGFDHKKGFLKNIIYKDGTKEPLNVLYASPEVKQQCEIPRELGCEFTDHGRIEVDLFQKTTVPGIYAAGDNSSMGRAVSVAVAAGSVAGMMLNKEMIANDFDPDDSAPSPNS